MAPTSRTSQICFGEAQGLTDFPIERLAQLSVDQVRLRSKASNFSLLLIPCLLRLLWVIERTGWGIRYSLR
jgi:hypothetical protein